MTTTAHSVPDRWRRLMYAALIVTGTTLTGTGFDDPAVAAAEPREWDIGSYDACVAKVVTAEWDGEINSAEANKRRRDCCAQSGGIVEATPQGGTQCVAPPKEAAGRTIPPGPITHDLTPLGPAPGDITQMP